MERETTGGVLAAIPFRQQVTLSGMLTAACEGFLRSVDDESRGAILSAAAEELPPSPELCACSGAPRSGRGTWRLLDGYGKEIRDRYWQ